MPILSGILISKSDSPGTIFHVSTDLSNYEKLDWPPLAGVSFHLERGVLIENYPVTQSGSRIASGYYLWGFEQDWYHRIHLRPAEVDLGYVLSDQVRQIEVWNAHFSAKTLNAVNASGADGITITGPTPEPTTFQPLESRNYTLTVSNTGAPTIDATFSFAFTGETPKLLVTGDRVSVWKTRPNWSRGIRERWEWLTDVLIAHDNHEQRVRLRARPRRSVEFDILPHEQERQWLENALWKWQARTFAVPVWPDQKRLDVDAAAGSNALSLDTSEAEFEVGGLVILLGDGIAEAGEITVVSATGLSLKTPLQMDWHAGASVFPARLGRIGDRQAVDRLTNAVSRAVVRFDFEDSGQVFTAQDSTASYRGWPVLEDGPNWVEDLKQEYHQKIVEFDWRTGGRFVEYQADVPNQLQSFRWTLSGRTAIDAFRRWLYARAGRLVPFWFPQPSNDLTATQIIGAGSTQLTVRHVNYTLFAQGQPGRRDIRVQLHDGTVLYRRVVAANELSVAEENLELDAPLSSTATIAPEEIVRISYLQPCRLNQDAVEILWHTDQLAESSAIIRSVNDDV